MVDLNVQRTMITGAATAPPSIYISKEDQITSFESISASPSGGEGVIGNITHDTSNTLVGGGYIYHTKFQPTTPGNINYIHGYIESHNGDTICMAIYSSTGARLGYGTAVGATDSAQWVNIALNTQVTLSAATNYYLGVATSANAGYYRKDTATGFVIWHDGTADTTWGRDVNEENSIVSSDRSLAIIANDTAGSPE